MHNAGQAGWNVLNCIKYELYTSGFNAKCVLCICDVVPNVCHQRAVLERDQGASDISADANVGSLSEAGGDTWDLQPRLNCHTCEFYVQGRKLSCMICKRHQFLLHEKSVLAVSFLAFKKRFIAVAKIWCMDVGDGGHLEWIRDCVNEELSNMGKQGCEACTCDIIPLQGGRTWQPFVGSKNGNENFRQASIYNFCDKCVVIARNCKFANLTQ